MSAIDFNVLSLIHKTIRDCYPHGRLKRNATTHRIEAGDSDDQQSSKDDTK